MKHSKSWMLDEHPIECSLNGRCHRVTVIAGIGTPLSRPVVTVARSTNQEDFRRFLNKLKEAVRPELAYREKPIVLLDNHS